MNRDINCLEFEEWLTDFEEGTAPPEIAAALRQHARQCAACASLQDAVRQTVGMLAELPEMELPASMMQAVLAQTSGQRRMLGWRETMGALWALLWQPRVAMSFGMALFAMAVVLNATGVNLRQLQWRDLTPHQMARTVQRSLNRGYARGAKYYNDLKLVYEIQAALHEVWQAAPSQPTTPPQHKNSNDPQAPAAEQGGEPALALAVPQVGAGAAVGPALGKIFTAPAARPEWPAISA